MTLHCHLFEAHSIQRWIFAGGRLRDAVGASNLLDSLCAWSEDDVFGRAVHSSGIELAGKTVARRAGGGLCVYHHDKTELAKLRAVLALLVREMAPDLPFVDAIGTGETMPAAFDDARNNLTAARNAPAPDPLRAGPFVLSTPRTGAPAVMREQPKKGGEILDAGLAAKRGSVTEDRSSIEQKFDPHGKARFPIELSDRAAKRSGGKQNNPVFPFLGDNRYVGLLHADGNGMGRILQTLRVKLAETQAPGFAEGFRVFSQALAEATKAAAGAAMKELSPSSKNVWPIRPLILGGDDLSAIVRGDYAINFAAEFLRAFETETKKQFDALRKGPNGKFWRDALPERLSAGAGIVFIKANQPFAQAYALAESLARSAKDRAKKEDWKGDSGAPPPATIAFHRITTSSIPERWSDVVGAELKSPDGKTELTMNPYVVTTEDGVVPDGAPRIERLEHLCRTLDDRDVARGPARMLTPAFLQPGWEGRWDRMLEMARRRNPDAAGRFVEALEALGCKNGPMVRRDGRDYTPLLDALSWIAVARMRAKDEKVDQGDASG